MVVTKVHGGYVVRVDTIGRLLSKTEFVEVVVPNAPEKDTKNKVNAPLLKASVHFCFYTFLGVLDMELGQEMQKAQHKMCCASAWRREFKRIRTLENRRFILRSNIRFAI